MLEGVLLGVIIVGITALFYLKKIAQDTAKTSKKLEELNLRPHTCPHVWEVSTERVIENNDEKKLVLIQKCSLCGILDKTVESLKKERSKTECRHKWIKQKLVNIESAYEQYAGEMKHATKDWRDSSKAWLDTKNLGPWAFRKTHVCTYVCELCGEINTIIASNYDLEDVPQEEDT